MKVGIITIAGFTEPFFNWYSVNSIPTRFKFKGATQHLNLAYADLYFFVYNNAQLWLGNELIFKSSISS